MVWGLRISRDGVEPGADRGGDVEQEIRRRECRRGLGLQGGGDPCFWAVRTRVSRFLLRHWTILREEFNAETRRAQRRQERRRKIAPTWWRLA